MTLATHADKFLKQLTAETDLPKLPIHLKGFSPYRFA